MKIAISGLLALIIAGAGFAQDATTLLAQIDAQRSIPDMDFELTITAYQGDKQLDSNALWGWVKTTGDGNKTILSFTEPASVKGRKMLMDGPTVYLQFPKTRNPIRLSPLQVLLGQSSNGDVARTGFSQEYDPQTLDTVTIDGISCWLFDLASKPGHQSSSYHRVKLWVDKASLKPLAADFYGSGDTILKHAVYSDWRAVGDKSLAFKLDITDGADATKHTVLQYSRVGHQSLPDSIFRRDYLQGWSPEAPK